MGSDRVVVETGSRREVDRDARALRRLGIDSEVRAVPNGFELLVAAADEVMARDRLGAFDEVRDLDETQLSGSAWSRASLIEVSAMAWALLVAGVFVWFMAAGTATMLGVGALVTMVVTGFFFTPVNGLFPPATARKPKRTSGEHGPLSQKSDETYRYRGGWIADLWRETTPGLVRVAPQRELLPGPWKAAVVGYSVITGALLVMDLEPQVWIAFASVGGVVLLVTGVRAARFRSRAFGWGRFADIDTSFQVLARRTQRPAGRPHFGGLDAWQFEHVNDGGHVALGISRATLRPGFRCDQCGIAASFGFRVLPIARTRRAIRRTEKNRGAVVIDPYHGPPIALFGPSDLEPTAG